MSGSRKPNKGQNKGRNKGQNKGQNKDQKKGPVDPKHRKKDERTVGRSLLQKLATKERAIQNSELAKKRREEKEEEKGGGRRMGEEK